MLVRNDTGLWYSTNTVSYQDLPCTLHCSGYNLHEVAGAWVGGFGPVLRYTQPTSTNVGRARTVSWTSARSSVIVGGMARGAVLERQPHFGRGAESAFVATLGTETTSRYFCHVETQCNLMSRKRAQEG